MLTMSEQSSKKIENPQIVSNIDLLNTAFLDGTNAAYIEAVYAEYVKNPNTVNSDLADFFKSLGDVANDVTKNAQGATWKTSQIQAPQDDILSALDYGQVANIVQKATDKVKATGTATADDIRKAVLGSIRAIMLVRAYRVKPQHHR